MSVVVANVCGASRWKTRSVGLNFFANKKFGSAGAGDKDYLRCYGYPYNLQQLYDIGLASMPRLLLNFQDALMSFRYN